MKLNFKKIEITNFLSYGDTQIFEFKSKGITLLNGKNGEGKSTIPSALYFALFGKSDRGILKHLINFNIGKKCLVKLHFNIDNDNYMIERGIKPNIFKIYKNNKLIEEESNSKLYQNKLNDIIGINEIIFFQLLYLGANITNSKNFFELSQKDKEAVFNILINLSEFNNLKNNTKEYLKHLKNKLSNKIKIEKILENDIKNISDSIKKQEEQNIEIVENKNKIINDLKNKILKLKNEKKNLEKNYIIIEKNIFFKTDEIKNKISKLKEEYLLLKHKIQLFDEANKNKKICPRCGYELKEIDLSNDEIENIKIKLEDLKNILKKLKNEYDDEILKEKEYNKKIEFNKELDYKISQINFNIKHNEEKIENISSLKKIKIDYSLLENKKEDFEKNKNDIIKLNKKIDECNDLLDLLSENKLKGEFINKYIPLLNYYVNIYLEKLNMNFIIKFDNKFKETIFYNDNEITIQSLSNGQKMRVTVALLFAFLKLVELKSDINFNVIILDEFINGSLDIDGVEDILKSLLEFSKNKEIILITHNTNIMEKDELFTRMIEIKKDKFSKIIIKK